MKEDSMQNMLIRSSVTVPALPLNLAELVLVTAIRCLPDAVNPDTDAAPIHSLLVVLPLDASVAATDLTRAALAQMWWVDLDFASRHGHARLLNTMFRWRHCRPLSYTGRGLYDAGKYCHVDVLDWWYAKREQCLMWYADVEFRDSGVKEGLESDDRSAPVAQLFQWYCDRYKVAQQLSSLQSTRLDANAKKELLEFVSVAIAAAVKHGHLAIIDTIRSWNNVDLRFDLSWLPVSQAVWHVVAGTKDLELCQWVLQLVSDDPWSDVPLVQQLAGAAFASGSVEMVEWVLQNKKVDFVLHQALEHASVELTRWAVDEQHLVKLDPETGKIIMSAEDGGQQFKFMDLRGVLQNASCKMPVLEWWTENASRLGVSLGLAFRSWDVMGPMHAGDIRFVKWWIANCDVDAVLAERNKLLIPSAVLSSLSGNLELLNLLYRLPQTQLLFCSPNHDGVDMATCHGLIHVLEWWRHTVTRPDSCLASHMGQLDCGIDSAGMNGNTKALTWWAQWFKEEGQGQAWDDILRKPRCYLQTASKQGRVETLDWWWQNSPDTIRAQNQLWDYMSPRVTRWWIKYGVSIPKTDKNWVAHAVHQGNTILLDYLLKHGYGPANRAEFANVATCIACQWGRPNVLEWLASHPGLPFEFGVNHVMHALGCNWARHWHVVAWWAGRVKAGDARCMLDMDELKAAILESESPDHEEDEDSEDDDDVDMNDGPDGRLWPLLIKYFLNPVFLL